MTDTAAPPTVQVLEPHSRADWLSMRRQDVTASQIGALLGVHPYCSRLQLFLEKSGRKAPDDDIDSAAMRRGRLLERLAFAQAQEALPDTVMEHNTYHHYWRDTARRIGCTPDVLVECPQRGRGVIQLKSVEPSIYRRTWIDGEPPLWVALQALTESQLTGAKWAAVGVLRVGHAVEFDLVDVPLDTRAWPAALDAVSDFWDAVTLNEAPPPDYAADGALIAALAAQSNGSTVDLTGDNELTAVLHDREELKIMHTNIEKQLAEYDAQIRFKVGEHEIATVGDFRISMKTENVKAYTVAARTRRPIRVKRIRGEAPSHD